MNYFIRSLERRIHELEKDLFYYKKTSRELKHRLREVNSSSTSTMAESMNVEKEPVSRAHSRDSNSGGAVDERRLSKTRVASPETQGNRSNENFHLPPVQCIVQEEKKSKGDQKKHDRLITQEEQKRLKVTA